MSVEINIDLDKTCTTCGEKGATPSGLCLACGLIKVIRGRDRIETISRELFVDLTADELRDRGEGVAVMVRDIEQAEAEASEAAKEARLEIQRLRSEARLRAHSIRERRELRMVEVDVVPAGDGKVSEVRRDTGEVTATRPMSDRERQLSLPKIGTATAAGGQ